MIIHHFSNLLILPARINKSPSLAPCHALLVVMRSGGPFRDTLERLLREPRRTFARLKLEKRPSKSLRTPVGLVFHKLKWGFHEISTKKM